MIIYLLGNAISSPGTMGGNTKIFLEFAKRWGAYGHQINIITYEGGFRTCQDYGLKQVNFIIVPADRVRKSGNPALYRTVQIIKTLNLIGGLKEQKNVVVYSASNFLPDVIPAIAMKKKFSSCRWVGTFYLFAPNPFRGFDFAYEKRTTLPTFKVTLSYLLDKITLPLLTRYADMVFVTNDAEKAVFVERGFNSSRIKAIYGGVSLDEIQQIPKQEIKYDGCFVGRVHPQKGVICLVKIWDYVRRKKPDAKLALIGNGPKDYMSRVRNEIKDRGLEQNIDLLGFVDGIEKYKILKASRVFCHTSVYDNSGMAAAEAMACGLPAVRFDLALLRVAYPRGMLTAPLRDCQSFGDRVIELLENQEMYSRLRREATSLMQEWNWDDRAEDALNFIKREAKIP